MQSPPIYKYGDLNHPPVFIEYWLLEIRINVDKLNRAVVRLRQITARSTVSLGRKDFYSRY